MLDRLRERFPWLATPLAVHQRVDDVGGGPLASSIALAGFVSLFPLLLVAIAVLGLLSANDTDFAGDVVQELGLTGRAEEQMLDVLDNAEDSRRAASLVGLAGLLWAGLGVAGTLEQAFNAMWQTSGRPGWKAKLVQFASLAGAGVLFLASTALAPAAVALPGPASVPTVLLGLVLDISLLLWLFRALTAVAVPWSDHLPGAVVGGVGLEVLKLLGGIVVPLSVSSSSALYGSLGIVFAVLAWLAMSARLVVYAAAVNVVRHEQRHGTVTVEIEVPRIEGEVPVQTTRGGAVADATPAGTDEPADAAEAGGATDMAHDDGGETTDPAADDGRGFTPAADGRDPSSVHRVGGGGGGTPTRRPRRRR